MLENQLKKARFIFLLCIIINIVVVIFYSVVLLITSSNLLNNLMEYFFNQIPYVGGILFNYLESLEVVKAAIFYHKVFLPVLSIELLYSILPLLIVEIVALFLQKRVFKKNNSYLSAMFIIILLLSLLLTQDYSISLIKVVFPNAFNVKNIIVSISLIVQLISFIVTLVYLNKSKRFSLDIINNSTSKLIKRATIVSLVFYLIIAGAFVFANKEINNLKQEYRINYVIDVQEKAEDIIHLDIPPKIKVALIKIGINPPEKITGVKILNQMGIKKLDVGKVINNFVDSKVNVFTNKYIDGPLFSSIIAILLLIVTFILEMIHKRKELYKNILTYLQLIISIALFFIISPHFTIIAPIITGVIFMAVFFRFYDVIKEKKLFISIKEKLSHSSSTE